MNYAQRYNTSQLDAAFKNAADMYELFSGQTDYYYGINNFQIKNNIQDWKNAFVSPYYEAYLIAREGFNNSLTKDQIKEVLNLVAYMDNIKIGFAPTNINTKSDDPTSWDNPFAKYYAEEAPTFTTYEPLAFYTNFPLGYSEYESVNGPNTIDWGFYDPNVGASVAQPGPWGTQAMVFENQADNNTFLFYDHFRYNKDYGSILKAKDDLKLKEGRKYTWNLTSETARLGLQTTEFRDSWNNFATAEEQNEFVINSIFSGLDISSSGFYWYLTQKANYSTINFFYRDEATIIAYRDFDESSFINDGGSFVFVEIENPQELQGSTVNCLCRYLEGKRVPIDDLWITQYPSGSGSITPVNHYPSTFDGIASFENKYPDHIAYPKENNKTSSEATKEYGHSFPESPSLDLVTDVNGQGMPQQILVGSNGESATYYPDGYTGAASTTKQDYDNSKQLKTQIGTGTGDPSFTQQTSISLIYPENSIGKTIENGTWYNTYDNLRYFSQSAESGTRHVFKYESGIGFTYPMNHSSKFGESFSFSGSSYPALSVSNFYNLEPLNFNKQILPWNDKSDYTGPQLKNQYITGASAASSHNYSEHYRSNESENSYPSAVDTLYHISTLNFKTGTFKVKNLDTGVFTSEDVFEFDGRISKTNTPRQYFSLPKGGDFLVIQSSSPFVSFNGYLSPTFAHQISVEFDPNHYSRLPRHIRYFEEGGIRYYMVGAKEGDRAKKKINWQVQRNVSNYSNVYGPFNLFSLFENFSNPILYAGHKHSAYPLDYEEVTLSLGTSDFEVPTLNVFGAAQFNSEIANYSSTKFISALYRDGVITGYDKISNNYLKTGEYNAFYQETNSDWELDPNQAVVKPIDIDPVLRWGVQDGRFQEGVSLTNINNSANFGSQKVKNIANLGTPYFNFKAEHKQRILNLNNLPRVYGTPHSVKHLNVGKINSHPDICYIDQISVFNQDGKVIDLSQADGQIYNEASNINYRLEFDGFVKAYGGPREDKTDILPYYEVVPGLAPTVYTLSTYDNPRLRFSFDLHDQSYGLDNYQYESFGGSYNREYDETYYKYSDDGNLSIEISVRRRYKNRRPAIPDLIANLVAENYSVVSYDSILSSYANSNQNPFGSIDPFLKISSSNYYTRMPYETYDINTYSPVPTEERDAQYNWHIKNGLLDEGQEELRRSL